MVQIMCKTEVRGAKDLLAKLMGFIINYFFKFVLI